MSLESISPHSPGGVVFFDRPEFLRLMGLYSRMVRAGEWKDYGVAGLSDVAVFSVFRRAWDQPLYRIEKRPALARRQGAWALIGQGGMILKRGHDLDTVLRVFDKEKFRVVK